MALITISKRKYKRNELVKYIAGECINKKIKYIQLADAIGITPQAFSKKMSRGQFSFDDLLIIFSILKPSKEDLAEIMTV